MRFWLSAVLVGFLSVLLLYILPWWSPMVLAFLFYFLFPLKTKNSFWSAGLGCGIAFLIVALYTDVQNEYILSQKMAALFHLPSHWLLSLLTSLIGFVTAGLGAWMAHLFRRVLLNPSNGG